MPEITVLMPVRNGEKYIKDAIDSVLQQSFEDFEFLIMEGCAKILACNICSMGFFT